MHRRGIPGRANNPDVNPTTEKESHGAKLQSGILLQYTPQVIIIISIINSNTNKWPNK